MKILILSLCLTVGSSSFADSIPLDNISALDLQKMIGEIGANFAHTTVSSASRIDDFFGIEVGLILGVTKIPEFNNIAQSVDPSQDDIPYLPHAGFAGRLTVPLGFTAEMSYTPGVDVEDFEFSNTGYGLGWDANILLHSPFGIGLKVQGSKLELEFAAEDDMGGAQSARFEAKTLGYYIFIDKELPLLTPYIGMGKIKANGELAASYQIFSYTADTTSTAEETSTHFIAGVNANFVILRLGFEYSRMFSTDKLTAKVLLAF